MRISDVDAYMIFDSRGYPTVEATLTLEGTATGRGCAPSGASTGRHEALELRDGDPQVFRGKGVSRAIENIRRTIRPALLGLSSADQRSVDDLLITLDGTPNKSRLGANATLATSLAFCAAAATLHNRPLYEHLGGGAREYVLPLPEIQIVGGGAHAAQTIDMQDFMIIAVGAATYDEALEMAFNVYHETGALLRERGQLVGLADEGGYWPVVEKNEDVIRLLLTAIERAGYTAGRDVALSLDVAATELCHDGKYVLASEGRALSPQQFADLMRRWIDEYPIASIEDPMSEDDWNGWQMIADAVGDRVQLVGDDLFATNAGRIEQGIAKGAANAVLIKLNQAGTVTETLDAIELTKRAGWNPIVSGRSGETEDAFIAHLAVATDGGQLKVGSFARSERMAKWNEVLRIQRRLGPRAQFAGAPFWRRSRDF